MLLVAERGLEGAEETLEFLAVFVEGGDGFELGEGFLVLALKGAEGRLCQGCPSAPVVLGGDGGLGLLNRAALGIRFHRLRDSGLLRPVRHSVEDWEED